MRHYITGAKNKQKTPPRLNSKFFNYEKISSRTPLKASGQGSGEQCSDAERLKNHDAIGAHNVVCRN
jgi:hypothetical protein